MSGDSTDNQLRERYYQLIAELWERFSWEDDILADIAETGGDPNKAGRIKLVRDEDTFSAELAQEVVDAASDIGWEFYDGSILSAADEILGSGECPHNQPGVTIAFDSPAGGYSNAYQRVFDPAVDIDIV